MDFSTIRCVTFDVVGTLIDFEAGIADYFASIGVRDDRERVLAAFGSAEAEQQIATPTLSFTEMLEPIEERMRLALEFDRQIGGGFRDSIPAWPAFHDSVEALARLGERFRLVALTNADNWALGHMARTLGAPFDDTVTCEDVGVNKPDPQMFAYCLGRQSVTGISKAEVLHTAQSQYHDIGASMALGYRTCWVERRVDDEGFGASPEPGTVTIADVHVSSLKELAELVDSALG